MQQSETIHQTVIGIDYGTKTVGLATGQTLTGSATELATLRYNETRKSRQQLVVDLLKVINEWQPQVLVIGWPLNMDGSESEFCGQVKKFADQLAAKTPVPVEFWDERLSSFVHTLLRFILLYRMHTLK